MKVSISVKKYVPLILIFILIAISIGLWEYLVNKYEIPKRILPKPSDISLYLYTEFFLPHKPGYESIFTKTLQSLRDALAGFVISLSLGSLIGIIFAHNELFRLILKPFAFLTQLLPVPAFAPVVAAMLGYDIETKLVIIVVFTIFPVIITMEKAVNSIPDTLNNLFRVYNASQLQRLRMLIIPSIVPAVMVNAKILVTASFVTSIIAELPLTVSGGIGKDIFNSFNNQINVRVWASLIVIAFISITFFSIISKFENYILTKYAFGKYES